MEIIKLSLSVTNDYLIKTNANNYILIDTGYVDDWNLFCKRLKELKIEIHNISHIILTHHHDDHCGLLNKIVEINNAVKIVMYSSTKDLLTKGENDRTHGGGLINKRIDFLIKFKQLYISLILRKHVDKNSNLKFPPYKARENDIIFNGEIKLSDIGINLPGKIIETPGHTVDSVSIVFENGDCFVGDAAANMLRFAGTKYCVIFIMNLKQYYESWIKIIKANAKTVYPAHGKAFKIDKLQKNIWKNIKNVEVKL
jgi:glyoxylase-like metal-dependent hydrolase (beta-lactamase superfamily II)